jgi:hypothetical protein
MRALLHYIPLVGLPLLGVSLVLEAGASFEAPPGVGGSWTFVPTAHAEATACPASRAIGPVTVLSVAQSGRQIVISLNDSWHGLPASVRRIGADSVELAIATQRVGFVGVIDRHHNPEQMAVQISWGECPGAPALTGIATRGTH